MDLNLLYALHQGALMRADATTSRRIRTGHLAAARMFANRIRNYQLEKGAAAAASWRGAVQEDGMRSETQ